MSSLENRDILRHMLMQRPSLQPENIKQVLPLNNNISSRSTEVVKQRALVNSRRKTDAKRQQINIHLTEIINYQEFLFALSDKNPNHIQVKRDFLLGLNGAPRMTVANLSVIETFHRLITSGRRAESPTDFFVFLNSPEVNHKEESEHFKLLMEGRDTVAEGTSVSYREGKFLLQRIRQSGYFDPFRYRPVTMKTEVKPEEIKITAGSAEMINIH